MEVAIDRMSGAVNESLSIPRGFDHCPRRLIRLVARYWSSIGCRMADRFDRRIPGLSDRLPHSPDSAGYPVSGNTDPRLVCKNGIVAAASPEVE
jgi:hypothetical protein